MKVPRTAALTGGIASGKSTVAGIFQGLGAHVIDADIVARQVVEPHLPAWKEIVEVFGQGILLENGRLNRKTLGEVVFQDPEKRRTLEQIVHPRVIAEIDRREQQIRKIDLTRVIIVDVPLLIEANMHPHYTTIVLAYVTEDVQMQRLMARDGLSEEQARQRLAAQMPLAEKCTYATHIIDNTETLTRTRKQVAHLYQILQKTPV